MKESNEEELEIIYHDEEVVVLNGFESAFLGFAERYDFSGAVAVYDKSVILRILMNEHALSESGAEDFFESNVLGSWVGAGTPVFVTIEPMVEH